MYNRETKEGVYQVHETMLQIIAYDRSSDNGRALGAMLWTGRRD